MKIKIQRKSYLVLLIIVAAIITSYAYLKKTNFFEIDACLDCGGRWDYQTEKCDTAFLPKSIYRNIDQIKNKDDPERN